MHYGKKDKLFFHYTTADSAFTHIVKAAGTLRLNPYSKMRDPFEAQDWQLGGAGFLPETGSIDQKFSDSVGIARQAKAQSKLLSLSVDAPYATDDDGFGRGYALASMWEFYAAKHTGVCLAFDRAQLAGNLLEGLDGKGTVFQGPIRYESRGLVDATDATTLMLGDGDSVQERVTRHVEAHHEALLFTKLADWEHEAEYRFALISEDTEPVSCGYGDSLRAVIVGHEFPHWQIPSALARCEALRVEAMQLIWTMNRPIVVPLRVPTP